MKSTNGSRRSARLPMCAAAVAACAAMCLAPAGRAADAPTVDANDTRLVAQPALTARHVAFAYDNDIWIADLANAGSAASSKSISGAPSAAPKSAGPEVPNSILGPARRITSHEGYESRPRFSPDGSLLAFNGEYDGNLDVYVIPIAGGSPRRLTWHPGPDVVEGFTPDGTAVLFNSPRSVYTGRHTQLFTVPIAGGFPTRLPIPHGLHASYAPDGGAIAYQPLAEAHEQWKHYRGGMTARIWLYDFAQKSVTQVPQPAERSNDVDPIWIGNRIFFRSDRAGEINLFSFDRATSEVRQLTRFTDFPVLAATAEGKAEGSRIVFEQAGWIHLLDTRTGATERLRIAAASDLKDQRPRFEKGKGFVRSGALSPTGARAVLEFRGEILTVPAEKGAPRNLSGTTGVHDRSPAWSPDGTRIAWVSDASGEYRLTVAPQDGDGETRTYDLEGAGFYGDLEWSPDGRWISYTDNSWSLYLLDLESGSVEKIGSEHQYGPDRGRNLPHSWSPDSKWLAYTLDTATSIQQVFLYSIASRTSHPVTDGLSEVSEPVFDAGGKYLYFFGSTDAGPVKQWFSMSNADMVLTRSLYLTVLAKGVESPFKPESDEEKGPGAGEETPDGDSPDGDSRDQEWPAGAEREIAAAEPPAKEGAKAKKGSAGKDAVDEAEAEKPVVVKVDFDGLDQRIVAAPIEPGPYRNLQAGKEGKIFYLRAAAPAGGPASLRVYDLEKREEKTLLAGGVQSFSLSSDRTKILYVTDEAWAIAKITPEPIDPAKGRLPVDQLEVRIDPAAEWPQIFNEAWRVNRDYFYDPGMHGADWPAMREKYAAFLPHVVTRRDLNRVIQWMCSELAVGHHRVGGGDERIDGEAVPGGLLGADYEIANGRYRFAKVFGGLNWDPALRAPLTAPGVDVVAGEYLLAVDGRELLAPEDVFGRFEKTAGKNVEITVGPSPDGMQARTVTVVPIESEGALRNRDWVERNLRRVQEATRGRVAYVYVPNTSTLGHTYFKRYFFPQAGKEAIIVDERHNGGGQVADYYIDHLRRPFISYWATRYGADIETPSAAIHGPKVMIIDETAGSGGDLLPWMFRKLELGTLVGRRTWGGLVGVLGFPVLMDGGFVTAPNLAIWTEDGFIVENEGVPPDVEVEQWPAEVEAGRDPQLERAIEIALEQLDQSPRQRPERPPFPVRVRPGA
jgi:tricorn protease